MKEGLIVTDLSFLTMGPFSLNVAPGETVGIRGPSGAGKTLLLRAIADLDPHSGRVAFDGIACEAIPASQWRKRVGLLPAESQWWHDRVGPHFNHVGDDLLEAVGFDREVLTWTITRLSVGERQRLGLIRLLDRTPEALLLDEPTANLDPENTERVEALIRDYRDKHHAPVLWVSHSRNQQERVANRQHILTDGKLEDPIYSKSDILQEDS